MNDFDAHEALACRAEACAKSSKPCPCPEACRIAEHRRSDHAGHVSDVVSVIAIVGLVCVLVLCVIAVVRYPNSVANLFF